MVKTPRYGRFTLLSAESTPEPTPAAPPAPTATITTIDNHVYFYAPVTPENCLELIRNLRNAAANLRAANFTSIPIHLHIMSDGGDTFAALAVVDQIGQIGWPIRAIAEGLCASAATLIALACDRCAMQRNAFLLLHSGDAGFQGTYHQFQDYAGVLDIMNEQIIDFYVTHTRADRASIVEMMKRDTWLNGTKALSARIVDEVL